MKFLWIGAMATALNACAFGGLVLMRNDRGETARCEVQGRDVFGVGMANVNAVIARCVKQYEAAGYKRATP